MLVWITGGTGFVGSTLIERLVSRGDTVVALVRPASRARLPAGARAVLGSLPDVSAFSAFPRPDVVFNCAAVIDGTDAACVEVNTEATSRLAEATAGARFVHLSTTDVYPFRSTTPVSESTPESPRTAYGRTKLEGERRLRALRPDAVVLRPPGIYGPRSERCIVQHTAKRLSRGTFFHVGDGSSVRSWIFVENLVDAMLFFAEGGRFSGTYLVDEGYSVSRAELTRQIALALGHTRFSFPRIPGAAAFAIASILERALPPLGRVPPLTTEGVRYALSSFALDTSRLRATGFVPRFTLAEGIEKTLAWARSTGANA